MRPTQGALVAGQGGVGGVLLVLQENKLVGVGRPPPVIARVLRHAGVEAALEDEVLHEHVVLLTVEVVQEEPTDSVDPVTLGLYASIGIQ